MAGTIGGVFYKRARTLYESDEHDASARRAMTEPGAIPRDLIHQRTADLPREHLREGYTRDDRETLQGAGERTP